MKYVVLFYVVFYVVLVGCWVSNGIKFFNCDFESPYKCEIVHAVGILPIASLVTVWIDTGEDPIDE